MKILRSTCAGALAGGLGALLVAASAQAGLNGLIRVASGLSNPMYVTHAPGDATRLFIVQKDGLIRILDLTTGLLNATAFLTIPDVDTAGDGGIQSMAFHPSYAFNGRFFVHVTVDNGGILIDGVTSPFSSHIREYTVSGNPDIANAAPTEIFNWVQPRTNHNGGWIGFDPGAAPRYLYIMSGDGGKQQDPDNNAQTIVNEPLGKILRIDVDGDDFPADPNLNYAVPPSNPFVGSAGDDEIWAYGLRNPWRASFDRILGDLWVADVGQVAREEIDQQLAASTGGENYAWNRREGLIAHNGGALLPGDAQPVYDYTHGAGALQGHSVVGGYVYRGADPSLEGLYFFADTISANVWTFDPASPMTTVLNINAQLTPDVGALNLPVSFGEDALRRLYIVDFNASAGEVFRFDMDEAAVPSLGAWGVAFLVFALVATSLGARTRRMRS